MSERRILLLYITEISGHHKATLAIENTLRLLDPRIQILNINAFNYTTPLTERIVNRLYISVIKKTPRIWEYLYDNPDIVQRTRKLKQHIHKFNSNKLFNLLNEFRPDVIACSQAYPCGMIADLKKTYGIKTPLIAVLTDYLPHAYWVYDEIDYYIVACEEAKKRLTDENIPEEKIKNFGIPVDPAFNTRHEKKILLEKLGLEPDMPTMLVMGGGQGLGPIKKLVNILGGITERFQLIVITGINRSLWGWLSERRLNFGKRLLAYEYVSNVDELMEVSDLIITKPGGLTTAEALSKGLPIIIIKPIPGQEANNTKILTRSGAARQVRDLGELRQVLQQLLLSPQELANFKQKAAETSKPSSSFDISRLILTLCPNTTDTASADS